MCIVRRTVLQPKRGGTFDCRPNTEFTHIYRERRGTIRRLFFYILHIFFCFLLSGNNR